MNLSDVGHFANMIDGCESLLDGNTKSPNAVYAFTVLKLHASDAGCIAGQEAYGNNVKAGATSSKWKAGFFQSAKAWLSNPLGSLPKFSALNKDLSAKLRPVANSVFSPALNNVIEVFKGENRSAVSKAKTLLDSLNSDNWTQVIFINMVVDLNDVMKKEIKGSLAKIETLRDKNPDHKKLGPLVTKVNEEMKAVNTLVKCITKYSNRTNSIIDKFIKDNK